MVEGGNVDARYDKAFPVSWERFKLYCQLCLGESFFLVLMK